MDSIGKYFFRSRKSDSDETELKRELSEKDKAIEKLYRLEEAVSPYRLMVMMKCEG